MRQLLSEKIKFNSDGLIPVITQDDATGEVLMLAYMNAEALEQTISTGKVHYFSRSRNKLWLKGETSGHFQYVKSICIDCDGDALLIKANQVDSACHTGNYSCFYREVKNIDNDIILEDKLQISLKSQNAQNAQSIPNTQNGINTILQEIYDVISDRVINPKEGSYTNYLFDKGIDKILKKVGEEAAEVIIASKNNAKDEIRYEVSDLIYHLLVLMVERGVKLEDVYNELKGRR